MAVAFARIDDRLLHGQVVTTWISRYSIEQVIIVSDNVAQDTTRQSILKISAPAGLRLVFFDTDKFIKVYNKTEIKRTTMLLFTNPEEVLRCINGGVKIPFLNVGNMSKKDDNEKITVGVAVTEEDRQAFKAILDTGVEVMIQQVPADKKENMADFVK
jgi:PTS system mannose-specific IIB component